MSTPTPADLGKVITSATVRKIIYTAYVVGVVLLGATQVAFAALESGQPAWLTAALAVAAYLGVPVAGLAAVNAASPGPSRDAILADFAQLDPDEQNADLQAALARHR